jgi:hypothetical protein
MPDVSLGRQIPLFVASISALRTAGVMHWSIPLDRRIEEEFP